MKKTVLIISILLTNNFLFALTQDELDQKLYDLSIIGKMSYPDISLYRACLKLIYKNEQSNVVQLDKNICKKTLENSKLLKEKGTLFLYNTYAK